MPLRDIVKEELARVADPARAAGAQTYMKSEMPFLGVAATPLRQVCKRVFQQHPIPTAAGWRREVLSMWRNARFREERYAAIELSGFKSYRQHQTLETIPMYEEMIVSGAWWDLVDVIASHRIGAVLLRNFPREMKPLLRKWSGDENMWKRRAAIIAQLTFKGETDLRLLYDCIEPSLDSKEFFLRKAIGWALRQYAWTNPEEVRRYVRENESRLAPLSRREALKNIRRSSAESGDRLPPLYTIFVI